MATANGSAVGITPMESTRRDGARPQSNPIDALAQLLGDVRAWARHQRMVDLAQAMDDAAGLLRDIRMVEARHG